jgi:hypothetical protein
MPVPANLGSLGSAYINDEPMNRLQRLAQNLRPVGLHYKAHIRKKVRKYAAHLQCTIAVLLLQFCIRWPNLTSSFLGTLL